MNKLGKNAAPSSERAYGSSLRRAREPMTRTEMTKRGKNARINQCPDSEWSKVVKARAGGVCQKCGRPGEEAHHLLEKGTARFTQYRHDVRNGAFLCGSCHQWGKNAAHNDRVRFRAEFAEDNPYFAELYAEILAKGQR